MWAVPENYDEPKQGKRTLGPTNTACGCGGSGVWRGSITRGAVDDATTAATAITTTTDDAAADATTATDATTTSYHN